MDKGWIALFSQTGSEIVNICNSLRSRPSKILTNNFDNSKYHPHLEQLGTPIIQLKHDDLMKQLLEFNSEEYFITLHGYLRIIPENVCSHINIYNGHPALVDRYVELKGKDAQDRIWNYRSAYGYIGAVVHEVIPEVDAGKIISVAETQNEFKYAKEDSREEFDRKLKELSLQSWLGAFNGGLLK